jgi:hypothetical protein
VELFKPEKAASAIWDDTDLAIEIITFKLAHRCCAHLQILSLEIHPRTRPTLLNITDKMLKFSISKILFVIVFNDCECINVQEFKNLTPEIFENFY